MSVRITGLLANKYTVIVSAVYSGFDNYVTNAPAKPLKIDTGIIYISVKYNWGGGDKQMITRGGHINPQHSPKL